MAASTTSRPTAVSMARTCPHCRIHHDPTARCRGRDTSDTWQAVTRSQAETVDAQERLAIATDNQRRAAGRQP